MVLLMGSKSRSDKESGLLVEEPELATAQPKLYNVVLLNDDYTSMEFVVMLLKRIFAMNNQQATQTMLQVHNIGRAICGVFTYEIAETKATQVNEYARVNDYPLCCIVEPAV